MTEISTPGNAQWSALQKIAFRFSFAFFTLVLILEPNSSVPFYDGLYEHLMNVFHVFIPWVAKNILHLAKPVTQFTSGSGDTTYDYLVYLFILVVAGLVSVIWSYTGRKTANYRKLFYWLLTVVRYYIAFAMIIYGSSKVVKVQFPAPTISRLMERVGDMSPMGLAWTYVGASATFNYITGCAELLCAGLLLFRRTKAVGAIVGVVVIGNIVAINYSFDVCVKLASSALLLMCFFILIPDYKRLINIFFRNIEVPPSDQEPHRFKAKWVNYALTGVKYALIFYIVYTTFSFVLDYNAKSGDNAPKPPLYGLYKVVTFVNNRDTLKPLTTDTTRWSDFWINNAQAAAIKLMNDSVKKYVFKPDTLKHMIALNAPTDTVHKFYFHYTVQSPDTMILQGRWKKDSIYVKLHKVDLKNFRLINRGFHMINEVPYNK